MIKFNILGAGGAVPTQTHSPAAYWVGVDKQNLLLDPGGGALVRLLKSGLAPRHRCLEVTEWDEHQVLELPGGGNVAPFRVNHPQDHLSEFALGYRFTDSAATLAVFSGDTGPCPALNKASLGADLLVVECSVPDELATDGHLHPAAVGALCAESLPGHVVLTHQYPAAAAMDLVAEVGKYFHGKISQARDGDSYQVGKLERKPDDSS